MFNLILGCLMWVVGFVVLEAFLAVFVMMASIFTGAEKTRSKLDKEDPKRFMPKELLEKA